jgi:predicted phosphoribosyltransferase
MGAIASGGVIVLNEDVVIGMGISSDAIREVAERESRELARREQAYREGRPMPELTGKIVILVDDGLATGSSMRAAILALRRLEPARIVVTVPAAPSSPRPRMRRFVICSVRRQERQPVRRPRAVRRQRWRSSECRPRWWRTAFPQTRPFSAWLGTRGWC